jgi:hypothetical protein
LETLKAAVTLLLPTYLLGSVCGQKVLSPPELPSTLFFFPLTTSTLFIFLSQPPDFIHPQAANMADLQLSPEEEATLVEDRVSPPSTRAGKRKISASFLLSSPSTSSPSSASSSVKSTASVRYRATSVRKDLTDFPKEAESAEALEFIGLQPDAAKEIFNRWTGRPDPRQCPDHITDYVYGWTSQAKRTTWSQYSDDEILRRLGVAPWLHRTLLDPKHKAIYETETLKYWLDETFRDNYNTILRIQEELKTYAGERTRAKKKKQKRGSVSDVIPTGDTSASSSTNPAATLTQQVATLSLASKISHFPQAHVTVGAHVPRLPNHEVFYKAKCIDEMTDNEQFILSDGSVNMDAIWTLSGGDFNPRSEAWYWTPEYETAVKYRDWSADRCRGSEVWIIWIQVSKDFLQTLKKEELWYSPDWKHWIWLSKKRARAEVSPMFYHRSITLPNGDRMTLFGIISTNGLLKDIPEKFAKYWKPGKDQTDVMLGHICTGVSKVMTKIPKNDVETRINEDDVLKIGNAKAKQWVVMHGAVALKLAAAVKGNMHIEIFPNEVEKTE